MAKHKKIKLIDNKLGRECLDVLNKLNPFGLQIELNELEEVCNNVIESMDQLEAAKFSALNFLMDNGVTPEDYSSFYDAYMLTENLRNKMVADNDEDDVSEQPFSILRHTDPVEEYTPMADSEEYTVVLKIQLKDVTKPPMWREIEVPACIDFLTLNEVIQTVNGFYDCHLWQFNKQAYDSSLVIGLSDDGSDNLGLEYVTHEAKETPLTMFLQKKGDKLEYTYDFGDDWIFTVEVKAVIKKKLEYPVCRKFKSDLNPIEDIGGVWSYLELRNDLEEWNSLSKTQRKKRADAHGFDSADEYFELITNNLINLDDLNDVLIDRFSRYS